MARTKEDPFKLYNLRYIPLFVIFFILGIFAVVLSVGVALAVAAVAAAFAFLLFYTKSVKVGVAIALVAVLFCGYGLARLELHLRNDVGLGGNVQITCRAVEVEAYGSDDEVTYIVIADRVRSGGRSYGGKITFKTDREIVVGDKLTLAGDVSIKSLALDNMYTALAYRMGAKYQVEPTSLAVEEGTPPLSYTIKSKIFAALTEFEGDRAGSFSYAMLFGDSEYMYDADKSSMRAVGVAHVFAVSGLHVGVLSAVLLFLLRKLKVKNKVILCVVIPVFGFYAYLAGFTPSVLRASLMVTLGLVAAAIGARYDDISALFFTAGVLLLVRPLFLFDISFQMSFLSIFGIQSLARPLERVFRRHKMKPWLSSGLALSLSTTAALLPVSAVVFGNISLIGFALNILVVPLASLAYVLTLFAVILTLITPAFGAVLKAISFLPLFIAELSIRAAALGLSSDYTFSLPEILVYYAIFALIGKYSLARRKVKIVAGGMGAGILLLLILFV